MVNHKSGVNTNSRLLTFFLGVIATVLVGAAAIGGVWFLKHEDAEEEADRAAKDQKEFDLLQKQEDAKMVEEALRFFESKRLSDQSP